jgi:hypothetical protein
MVIWWMVDGGWPDKYKNKNIIKNKSLKVFSSKLFIFISHIHYTHTIVSCIIFLYTSGLKPE